MSNKHLIALDLDGTLLTANQDVSPKTMGIIEKAMEDGHIVVIATGRSHRSSLQHYHKLCLTTPMVNFNGAFIHHPNNNKWGRLHHPLSHQTALEVIDACYDLDVYNIIAKVQDHIYIDKHDQKVIDTFQSIEAYQTFSPFNIGNVKQKLKDDPTTLLILPKQENLEGLHDLLNTQHPEVIDHRNWGAPWNITEITKKGINKAIGLKKIADYYNIPQDRIIAFGDGDNDIEMLDYAGVGVAMDNAIKDLKLIAKHITDTNENDGIGSFLEEYLHIQTKVS